jgi:RHS repeat-associated protein
LGGISFTYSSLSYGADGTITRPGSGISTVAADAVTNPTRTVGDKNYELSNHLGNVMVVVTDKKIGVSTTSPTTDAEYYLADVLSSQDYYSFGATMPGRGFNITATDRGFNGKREDNEIYGEGNALDFGARMYDPRLGRFMRTDPAHSGFSFETPYSFAGNTPIQAIDREGESIYFVGANGAVVNAMKTLIQTEDGRRLIAKYQSSTTQDIYINVGDFGNTAETTGNSDAVASTMYDIGQYGLINNGKIVDVEQALLEAGHVNDAEQMSCMTNVDVSKSEGRTVSIVALNTRYFNDTRDDNYNLAETIYHEIYAHILQPDIYPGFDDGDLQHKSYGSYSYGLSPPSKGNESSPYGKIRDQLLQVKQNQLPPWMPKGLNFSMPLPSSNTKTNNSTGGNGNSGGSKSKGGEHKTSHQNVRNL